MVENLNYFVAPLLLGLFGLPAAYAPGTRRASAGVRLAMSFMTGTVVFVVWETVLSVVGVAWSLTTVAIPLGTASLVAAVIVSRRDDADQGICAPVGWNVLAIVVGAGAFAHLALKALTSRATSIDFFYFWGVKAMKFADARGIDAEYLSAPFVVHGHVPYPPLVPVVGAWGIELVGRLPWRAGLASMAMWILLAYPVVLRGLRSRLPVGEATIAAGVWLVGVSIAVASSLSAGNAEPPLVFFATVAVIALIAREGVFPGWVAPVAACGVVLTKSEGVVFWVLLVAGLVLRGAMSRTPWRELLRRLSGIILAPPLALAPWYAFLVRHDIPLSDAAREAAGDISAGNLVPAVIESLRNLEAGSGWIAWGLAVVVLALSWRGWKTVLPALAMTGGTLAFLLVYYLHFQGADLAEWVRWTLPRVSLAALSAALLAAAVASGKGGEPQPGTSHENR